jgi:hypothetical protein
VLTAEDLLLLLAQDQTGAIVTAHRRSRPQ